MINKSTDPEVRALIQALGADDEARREAAIARLIIIGNRAVGRLVAEFESSADRMVQHSILRVLEAAAERRCIGPARRALQAGGDLAVAALAVFRELLVQRAGDLQVEALDALLAIASDGTVERRARAAAAEALQAAPEDVRAAVRMKQLPAGAAEEALWDDALEGHLPEDVDGLREALANRAEKTPLAVLRRLVDCVRERERQESASRQDAWRKLRGALHQALAARGSRVALYDLRESFEAAADPLPPSFLAAVQTIGDESCLEPIAAAYRRAPLQQERWRLQLVHAFHTVSRRERLTQKHPAMRRALAKMGA